MRYAEGYTMTDQAAVRRETVPMNVLIVDDELAVRETCATVAEQCGMKAISVATAEEALEVLEHSAIDILLTDLKLPRTNGVELLKLVHDLHPEVAAVVLTQYGTIESALEVTRMGAVDYVTKPFRIEELRFRLERGGVKSAGYHPQILWSAGCGVNHLRMPAGKRFILFIADQKNGKRARSNCFHG